MACVYYIIGKCEYSSTETLLQLLSLLSQVLVWNLRRIRRINTYSSFLLMRKYCKLVKFPDETLRRTIALVATEDAETDHEISTHSG